jgi:hypothetical protein
MSKPMLCAVTDDASYDASDYEEGRGYYKVKRVNPASSEPENHPGYMSLNKTLEPLITEFGGTQTVDENGTIHLDWSHL